MERPPVINFTFKGRFTELADSSIVGLNRTFVPGAVIAYLQVTPSLRGVKRRGNLINPAVPQRDCRARTSLAMTGEIDAPNLEDEVRL